RHPNCPTHPERSALLDRIQGRAIFLRQRRRYACELRRSESSQSQEGAARNRFFLHEMSPLSMSTLGTRAECHVDCGNKFFWMLKRDTMCALVNNKHGRSFNEFPHRQGSVFRGKACIL